MVSSAINAYYARFDFSSNSREFCFYVFQGNRELGKVFVVFDEEKVF